MYILSLLYQKCPIGVAVMTLFFPATVCWSYCRSADDPVSMREICPMLIGAFVCQATVLILVDSIIMMLVALIPMVKDIMEFFVNLIVQYMLIYLYYLS